MSGSPWPPGLCWSLGCTLKGVAVFKHMTGKIKKDVGILCRLDQIHPKLVSRMTIDSVREELRVTELSTSGCKEELVGRLVRHRRRETGELD